MIKILLRLAFYLPRRLAHKSPTSIARKLWLVATNATRQASIMRALAQPAFADYTLRFPCLTYKYIEENDLAQSFTMRERATCHLHHYRFLQSRFSSGLLSRLLQDQVSVFEACEDGHRFVIAMAVAIQGFYEGELRLVFQVDGDEVFGLSFTFIPGSLVGSKSRDVVLISRLQGVKGRHELIYLAEKALLGIKPAALLVSALEGVCAACGVSELAGVTAANQPYFHPEIEHIFKLAYDDFFTDIEATIVRPGFFHSPIPLHRKPMELINKSKRARARKRRAFKSQIADEVCQALQPALTGEIAAWALTRHAVQNLGCLDV